MSEKTISDAQRDRVRTVISRYTDNFDWAALNEIIEAAQPDGENTEELLDVIQRAFDVVMDINEGDIQHMIEHRPEELPAFAKKMAKAHHEALHILQPIVERSL